MAKIKKTNFQQIDIHIDRPKGFVQKGKSPDGAKWERVYKLDYGFIPGTKGGDGEDLDVFLGPNAKSDTAFWVTQRKEDGSFDEYKIFLGFNSQLAAKRAYLAHIPRKFYGGMEEMPVAAMRGLLNKEPMAKSAMFRVRVSCLSKRAAVDVDMDKMHGEVGTVNGADDESASVVFQTDTAPYTKAADAASYVLTNLLKLGAPRAVKELRKAMGLKDHALADHIGKTMQEMGGAPRFVHNLSHGGQEAAVDLMVGAPIAGKSSNGLFARKIYKPDSGVTRGTDTTALLAEKKMLTDKIRSISPEARAATPAMYGAKELHSGTDRLRHISDHEFVPGLREMNPKAGDDVVGITQHMESKVYNPLARAGHDIGDVPRTFEGVRKAEGSVRDLESYTALKGNASNVMLDPQGQPKLMDFLPHKKDFSGPVHLSSEGTGVLTAYNGGTSYGEGSQRALKREVFQPSAAVPAVGFVGPQTALQNTGTQVIGRGAPPPISEVRQRAGATTALQPRAANG